MTYFIIFMHSGEGAKMLSWSLLECWLHESEFPGSNNILILNVKLVSRSEGEV